MTLTLYTYTLTLFLSERKIKKFLLVPLELLLGFSQLPLTSSCSFQYHKYLYLPTKYLQGASSCLLVPPIAFQVLADDIITTPYCTMFHPPCSLKYSKRAYIALY